MPQRLGIFCLVGHVANDGVRRKLQAADARLFKGKGVGEPVEVVVSEIRIRENKRGQASRELQPQIHGLLKSARQKIDFAGHLTGRRYILTFDLGPINDIRQAYQGAHNQS
jgi:hypothetical protein